MYFFSYTPLILSASYGFTETVQLLLQSGADVSAAGQDQHTAINFAAQEGHLLTVRELLASGANKEIRDGDG